MQKSKPQTFMKEVSALDVTEDHQFNFAKVFKIVRKTLKDDQDMVMKLHLESLIDGFFPNSTVSTDEIFKNIGTIFNNHRKKILAAESKTKIRLSDKV